MENKNLNKAMATTRVALGVAELSLNDAVRESEMQGSVHRHIALWDVRDRAQELLREFVCLTQQFSDK